jgi:hypothetical protein
MDGSVISDELRGTLNTWYTKYLGQKTAVEEYRRLGQEITKRKDELTAIEKSLVKLLNLGPEVGEKLIRIPLNGGFIVVQVKYWDSNHQDVIPVQIME